MHSGRTQQLLPQPHTHTYPSPYSLHTLQPAAACVYIYVCVPGQIQEMGVWMSHFEQHSTGRSEGSQTAFWDIIQPPTQQMCWVAPSLARLSLGVFLLGKQHLEFTVYCVLNCAFSVVVFCLYCSFFYFSTPLCLSIP